MAFAGKHGTQPLPQYFLDGNQMCKNETDPGDHPLVHSHSDSGMLYPYMVKILKASDSIRRAGKGGDESPQICQCLL